MLAAGLVVAACGTSSQTTTGAGITGSTVATRTPDSATTGSTRVDATAAPSTNAPTTHPGGGTDTPATVLEPDATRGVIRGRVVQQVMCVTDPCPPQPVAANVQILSDGPSPTGPGGVSVPNTIVLREVAEGASFGALLAPGKYTLETTARRGLSCPTTTAIVTAAQVTEITIECRM